MPTPLRLEFQYAMQCRHDERTVTARPQIVRRATRFALESGVSSLLDHSYDQWRAIVDALPTGSHRGGRRVSGNSFLLFAVACLETLRDGTGLDVEYPRDTWRVHRIGVKSSPSRTVGDRAMLRFDRISQPWLRDLAKRWLRLRITSGLSITKIFSDLQAITLFAEFFAQLRPAALALAEVNRDVLERYIAWVPSHVSGPRAQTNVLSGLSLFLQGIRQHRWTTDLPTDALLFPSDVPKRAVTRISRFLAEHVMAQIEQPANLDRWPDPAHRLVTAILVHGGLRVGDACGLPFDCIIRDGNGAPYLRYVNHKMNRDAAVPIDDVVAAQIFAQQQRVLARWLGGCPHLFPRQRGNANGSKHLSPSTYRRMLDRWLTTCEVQDEHGRPAHLTPHQWRHTFATRLINRDVPQEVVQLLLDHSSPHMTSHYAKISNATVRRKWEQAVKVNIRGEHVTLAPDGPLAQAQWANLRFGIATQTLPNGYCGLPVQKSCPHANACLTCPVFVTGAEFLPQLREQRVRTLTLLDNAAQSGHARVTEMNQQVLTNLNRMIDEIETTTGQEQTPDAG
ncbi:site-specific integrase [Micromonospora radicis]|uniref:Site-specific integrase n=1 Tax=Micromonospora radicis TaxID=1894971 RepID=A0A418MMK6_9ACTN|nr:site-specific integrase [Micromonospora radicis]